MTFHPFHLALMDLDGWGFSETYATHRLGYCVQAEFYKTWTTLFVDDQETSFVSLPKQDSLRASLEWVASHLGLQQQRFLEDALSEKLLHQGQWWSIGWDDDTVYGYCHDAGEKTVRYTDIHMLEKLGDPLYQRLLSFQGTLFCRSKDPCTVGLYAQELAFDLPQTHHERLDLLDRIRTVNHASSSSVAENL